MRVLFFGWPCHGAADLTNTFEEDQIQRAIRVEAKYRRVSETPTEQSAEYLKKTGETFITDSHFLMCFGSRIF